MANEENLTPFKKGNNANPKGRPKGSKNKSTIFKEALALKDKNGVTNETKLVAMLMKLGIEGDLKAILAAFDGAHGKDKQTVETTVKDSKPIKVEFFKNDGELKE